MKGRRILPCVSPVSKRQVGRRRGACLVPTSHAIFTTLPELREAEAVKFTGIRVYLSICMDSTEWGPHKYTRGDGYAI